MQFQQGYNRSTPQPVATSSVISEAALDDLDLVRRIYPAPQPGEQTFYLAVAVLWVGHRPRGVEVFGRGRTMKAAMDTGQRAYACGYNGDRFQNGLIVIDVGSGAPIKAPAIGNIRKALAYRN